MDAACLLSGSGRSVAPCNPGSKEIMGVKSGTLFGPTYFAFVIKYIHQNHILIIEKRYVVGFESLGF